jgi:GTP-binding protein LepA
LPNADPDAVKYQLEQLFEIDPKSVLLASAKTGLGIGRIFQEIIRRIPPPNRHGQLDNRLRFLLQVRSSGVAPKAPKLKELKLFCLRPLKV